jgi:hypothetical protein
MASQQVKSRYLERLVADHQGRREMSPAAWITTLP